MICCLVLIQFNHQFFNNLYLISQFLIIYINFSITITQIYKLKLLNYIQKQGDKHYEMVYIEQKYLTKFEDLNQKYFFTIQTAKIIKNLNQNFINNIKNIINFNTLQSALKAIHQKLAYTKMYTTEKQRQDQQALDFNKDIHSDNQKTYYKDYERTGSNSNYRVVDGQNDNRYIDDQYKNRYINGQNQNKYANGQHSSEGTLNIQNKSPLLRHRSYQVFHIIKKHYKQLPNESQSQLNNYIRFKWVMDKTFLMLVISMTVYARKSSSKKWYRLTNNPISMIMGFFSLFSLYLLGHHKSRQLYSKFLSENKQMVKKMILEQELLSTMMQKKNQII